MSNKTLVQEEVSSLLNLYLKVEYNNDLNEVIPIYMIDKSISMKDISKIDIYGLTNKTYSFHKMKNDLMLKVEQEEEYSVFFEDFYCGIIDEYAMKLYTHSKIKYDTNIVTILK